MSPSPAANQSVFTWQNVAGTWVRDDGVTVRSRDGARILDPGLDFSRGEVLALCDEFKAPVPAVTLPPNSTYVIPSEGHPTSRTEEQLREIADRCLARRVLPASAAPGESEPDELDARLLGILRANLRVVVQAGSDTPIVTIYYKDVELCSGRAS